MIPESAQGILRVKNKRNTRLRVPVGLHPSIDVEERKIPLTPGVDPLDLLTNDGNNAKMTSEGLPADRISLENGSIITNCKRWPLIIDPQQQVSRPIELMSQLSKNCMGSDEPAKSETLLSIFFRVV